MTTTRPEVDGAPLMDKGHRPPHRAERSTHRPARSTISINGTNALTRLAKVASAEPSQRSADFEAEAGDDQCVIARFHPRKGAAYRGSTESRPSPGILIGGGPHFSDGFRSTASLPPVMSPRYLVADGTRRPNESGGLLHLLPSSAITGRSARRQRRAASRDSRRGRARSPVLPTQSPTKPVKQYLARNAASSTRKIRSCS